MSDIPEPLTPADCDLRDFKFMPLDVVRLRDSDIATVAEGDEFRCAVLLWCASWHQVPAASLPDDDKLLAQYAGFGRVVKEWLRVRAGALRGWIKCSDGRLYHPVVAEKANESWLAKLRQRLKTECGRIKKHNERHGTKIRFPDFDDWFADGCPTGQALPVPGDNSTMSPRQPPSVTSDKDDMSQGQDSNVTGENPSKGQGEGQGEGQLTSKPDTSSQDSTTGERQDPSAATTTPSRGVQIAVLLRKLGIDATSQHPLVCLTWANDPKVTDEVLEVAVAKAKRAKKGQRIHVNYLENIVGESINPPERADNSWKRTDQGIEKKGREMGMFARVGEDHRGFASRIEAEILKRQREGGKAA